MAFKKHHQNSTRRPPRERTKFAVGEGKKREILGSPAEERSGGGRSGGGRSRREETDFGQSHFGHPDLTNFGQSIFGHLGFGPANVGQNQFWLIQFGPIHVHFCVVLCCVVLCCVVVGVVGLLLVLVWV